MNEITMTLPLRNWKGDEKKEREEIKRKNIGKEGKKNDRRKRNKDEGRKEGRIL